MKRINFLEKKSFSLPQFQLNYFWVLVFLAIVVALFAGFTVFQKSRLARLQSQVQGLEGELERLRASDSIKLGSAVIQEIGHSQLKNPLQWNLAMMEIASNTPASVRLEQISGALADPRKMTIQGLSEDLPSLLRMESDLKAIHRCKKPILASLEEKKSGISFKFECQIQ